MFWSGKQELNRRSSRVKSVRMWAETVESIQASSVRVMSLYGNILQHWGKNEREKSLRCSSKRGGQNRNNLQLRTLLSRLTA